MESRTGDRAETDESIDERERKLRAMTENHRVEGCKISLHGNEDIEREDK